LLRVDLNRKTFKILIRINYSQLPLASANGYTDLQQQDFSPTVSG